MTVSIELFLLDNVAMNLLILKLAGALAGGKARLWRLLTASAAGAVYALLSMTVAPVLGSLPCKLLLGGAMALSVAVPLRAYPKALVCTLLSACLMGGMLLGLTQLFGGGVQGGATLCTVPVRAALLSLAVGSCLPRAVLALVYALRQRAGLVRLKLVLMDRTMELTALLDTGNLLVEPLSGKPVVIVRPGLLPERRGRPVPFRTVDGQGTLEAFRPEHLYIRWAQEWREADAYLASAKVPFRAADAIIGSALLPLERWEQHETEPWEPALPDLPRDPCAVREGDSLHPHGGNTSAAVSAGSGASVDSEAYGR